MTNLPSSLATKALTLLCLLPMACGGGDGDGGGDVADGGPVTIDADLNVPPTAFRASRITLLDPHALAFGTVDVTDTVNGAITSSIEMDANDPPDNILDLNVSIVFQPLDPQSASSAMSMSFAECSAPLATTACTQTAATTLIPATATNESAGTCLAELPGTTTVYDPATPVVPVPAPCFVSDSVDVTVPLGTITLPLKSAQISATYSGAPVTSLVTGLLRGYVTKADADAVLLPDSVPLLGGSPLSDVLSADDMDTGPNGEDGWWFYIAVEADRVDYTIQ